MGSRHPAGEDAWKAIDIAEVMKKAGSPVPAEMQQAPEPNSALFEMDLHL